MQPIIQSGVQTWKALILVHPLDIDSWLMGLGSQGYARGTQICIVCSFAEGSADIDRREAANQTQWFDGIIRTVQLSFWQALMGS